MNAMVSSAGHGVTGTILTVNFLLLFICFGELSSGPHTCQASTKAPD